MNDVIGASVPCECRCANKPVGWVQLARKSDAQKRNSEIVNGEERSEYGDA